MQMRKLQHAKMDGIRKVPVKPRPQPETKIIQQAVTQTFYQAQKQFSLLGHFDFWQNFAIISAFVAAIIIPFASGQALTKPDGIILGAHTDNSVQEQPPSSVIRGDTPLLVTDTPNENASFDNIVLTQPEYVFLPEENVMAPDPLLHRKEFLKQYLESKHSVLADHVDAITEQSQWKLIIAIAQAESSSCKKYPEHTSNCWGIGGASNLMQFKDLDAAIAHVNSLLEKKYISQGLTSTQKLEKKWVGYQSIDWENAVEQELENLKDVQ